MEEDKATKKLNAIARLLPSKQNRVYSVVTFDSKRRLKVSLPLLTDSFNPLSYPFVLMATRHALTKFTGEELVSTAKCEFVDVSVVADSYTSDSYMLCVICGRRYAMYLQSKNGMTYHVEATKRGASKTAPAPLPIPKVATTVCADCILLRVPPLVAGIEKRAREEAEEVCTKDLAAIEQDVKKRRKTSSGEEEEEEEEEEGIQEGLF